MARAAGSLHTAIGLQGRLNPAVRRAAQLISSGKIGRPLNARIVSTNIGFGPELPSSYDYFNKTSSGANLLTINGGHALDLVEAVLGPIIEIDARTEILWPAVKLTDTGEESETADHFAVLGKTQSGAVFTAEIYGGVAPQDTRSSFEIRGSEAWLSLTSDHPYGIHAGDPTLRSNIPFVTPPTSPRSLVASWARRSTWERSTLIWSVICVRAPASHRVFNTHFTTPVSSRL